MEGDGSLPLAGVQLCSRLRHLGQVAKSVCNSSFEMHHPLTLQLQPVHLNTYKMSMHSPLSDKQRHHTHLPSGQSSQHLNPSLKPCTSCKHTMHSPLGDSKCVDESGTAAEGIWRSVITGKEVGGDRGAPCVEGAESRVQGS